MGTVDHYKFEKRGARGCSNSGYDFCRLSCCDAWCVEDDELQELYFDATDLKKVVSMIDGAVPCPVCGAREWSVLSIDDPNKWAVLTVDSPGETPPPWRWALHDR